MYHWASVFRQEVSLTISLAEFSQVVASTEVATSAMKDYSTDRVICIKFLKGSKQLLCCCMVDAVALLRSIDADRSDCSNSVFKNVCEMYRHARVREIYMCIYLISSLCLPSKQNKYILPVPVEEQSRCWLMTIVQAVLRRALRTKWSMLRACCLQYCFFLNFLTGKMFTGTSFRLLLSNCS